MVILSLVLAMAVVLFMAAKKINIGLSLVAGSILLLLLNGQGGGEIVAVLVDTLTDYTTINLALSIALITVLGHLMDRYGLLDRMIRSLEGFLKSAKLTILLAPAIIGTLLVTGGALLSCPVVDELGERLGLSADRRAAVNLVFRHALYFIYPLSPPMILAVELGGFAMLDLIKIQLPIAVVMYLIGYFVLLGPAENPEHVHTEHRLVHLRDFLTSASPILVSLLGVIVFALPFYLSLVLGILVAWWLHNRRRLESAPFLSLVHEGFRPGMVLAILGIMLFKTSVDRLDELFLVLEELFRTGLPIELLIFLAAALISFPMASTQPGIAILYPLILPLATNPDERLIYGMFIYTSAFVFYYISPLHMCQVLTLEYFKVDMRRLYRHYATILPAIYTAMIGLYVFHRLTGA